MPRLSLARGRFCSPSPLFISSGDRPSWRSAWACARCRRFFWRACVFWSRDSFSMAGCAHGARLHRRRASGARRRFWRVLIFVFDYGLLFWAEKRVPSGIAAVMMATIPVFMAIAEIIFLRTQRLTLRLGLALLVGHGRRRRSGRTLGEPGRSCRWIARAPAPCSSRRSVGRWLRLSAAGCRRPPLKS